jgi:hypothetical protein
VRRLAGFPKRIDNLRVLTRRQSPDRADYLADEPHATPKSQLREFRSAPQYRHRGAT